VKVSRRAEMLAVAAIIAVTALVIIILSARVPRQESLVQAPPPPSVAGKPSPAPAPPWQPGDRSDVRRDLASIFGNAIFTEDSGIAVLALDGTPLYLHRAVVPLTPASTLKLIVAATALDILGPKERFGTSFVALDGPDADGVIHGPLWLVGSGDPLFTSNDLRGGIGALRRLGVKRIDGPLVVDDSAFSRRVRSHSIKGRSSFTSRRARSDRRRALRSSRPTTASRSTVTSRPNIRPISTSTAVRKRPVRRAGRTSSTSAGRSDAARCSSTGSLF
jgi:hypothetical protein